MPCTGPDHARQLLELGARFLAYGADITFVKFGLEEMQRRFKLLGFMFDSRL
jgi:hypothetical protein